VDDARAVELPDPPATVAHPQALRPAAEAITDIRDGLNMIAIPCGATLPLTRVEFRQASGSAGVVLDRIIPDTGADASVLPWAECQLPQLVPTLGVPGYNSGVAGASAPTIAFRIWNRLDGQDYACRLQVDFVGSERILGRDVLNRLEILFRGPVGEVVLNP
jgi:hypothetical protein